MIMHPPEHLGDSINPVCNEDNLQLRLNLFTTSITEYHSDGQQRSSQETPPLRSKADVLAPSAVSFGSLSPLDGRRKLLLIYIHGFMGAEDSFRRFPAHVHNLVANAVAESHVVYTKVYPRYKSRGAMSVARDEFSEWSVNT